MKPILTIIFLIAAQFGEAQNSTTKWEGPYIYGRVIKGPMIIKIPLKTDTVKLKKVTADFGVILQIDSLSGDIFAVVDTNIWQLKTHRRRWIKNK